MALKAAQATQISMALVAAWLLDTLMATGGSPDQRHLFGLWWQQKTTELNLTWGPDRGLKGVSQ